jgi:serine/threonine protein kinase
MGVIIYELLYGRTPFYTGNEVDTKAKIRALNYGFRNRPSIGVGPYPLAEDLFKKIFVHPANRITLEHILAHPWLQQYQMQQHPF